MFYEVRVYTPKGILKKVVSQNQLSKRHWTAFNKIFFPGKPLKALQTGLKAGKT
ncbi:MULTISPECIES: hypothetical protein [unclassified Nitrospina]|uniref:hypothetical protein n=1 Tax=unclassified Nitrospina TaxID=2638683 RepID=UPI003F9945E6